MRKGESRIEQCGAIPLAYQRDTVQRVTRNRAGHAHRESVQGSRCGSALQGNVGLNQQIFQLEQLA
jgi:hypothetical protein